jgi:hypothetical protein
MDGIRVFIFPVGTYIGLSGGPPVVVDFSTKKISHSPWVEVFVPMKIV